MTPSVRAQRGPRRRRSDIARRQQGNDLVAGLGFDVLDPSAVAKPSKPAGAGERIEDDGLVRGT
jgi:hypothetical protein